MMQKGIDSVYFIGAGGIGMSAIARYFMSRGLLVAGYDRVRSRLCEELEREGMLLHYEDNISLIPSACLDKERCLVVWTPAIPPDHSELNYFRNSGFRLEKRAQVLGRITRSGKALCVAGTHGKTTSSAMLAHILHQSHLDCNAFLGGISKNYATNHILSSSEYVVVEADEYDRSFHNLSPYIALITSADPDHLDIYGSPSSYLDAFTHFTSLINPGGFLVLHDGVSVNPRLQEGVRLFSYGTATGDFHAENIRINNGSISFDFVGPLSGRIPNISLGQPIPINIDNAVGAMSVAQLCGCEPSELAYGISTYSGVDRRFDFKINTPDLVLLSDYAHHPREIAACAKSLRILYPNRRLTVIFQPHLYTRTRDFHREFSQSLSLFDEVILTDIYPAREKPIPGVGPKLILDDLSPKVRGSIIRTDDVLDYVKSRPFDVLCILGAGDLDDKMPQIENIITSIRFGA